MSQTGALTKFEVLFNTKNCSADDWQKFWTDFKSSFGWQGTTVTWRASEDTENVQQTCLAEEKNCQYLWYLLKNHGFKRQTPSTGHVCYESPDKIPTIDMSLRQKYYNDSRLAEANLKF
ncbi:unnamed protein product [Clonostachys rosea]|uniref:Uncharacterized protein n=1 Tax=Bionectria ochroleuca TaxID=29856 RepID=A0ABY6U4I3_BIOOC|nr:unnamed protein product [Clonostachys rosea]